MDAKQNGEQAAFAKPYGNRIGRNGVETMSSDTFGLTKRELAAMINMAGLLANPALASVSQSMNFDFSLSAVEHADALLAELAKEVKP